MNIIEILNISFLIYKKIRNLKYYKKLTLLY